MTQEHPSETVEPTAAEQAEQAEAEVEHRQRPSSPAFRAFIASGWGDRPAGPPPRLESAAPAAARRAQVSRELPGERLVIPAGVLRRRSNDTDYRFRPHSAFAHLTGLGTDREPDAV